MHRRAAAMANELSGAIHAIQACGKARRQPQGDAALPRRQALHARHQRHRLGLRRAERQATLAVGRAEGGAVLWRGCLTARYRESRDRAPGRLRSSDRLRCSNRHRQVDGWSRWLLRIANPGLSRTDAAGRVGHAGLRDRRLARRPHPVAVSVRWQERLDHASPQQRHDHRQLARSGDRLPAEAERRRVDRGDDVGNERREHVREHAGRCSTACSTASRRKQRGQFYAIDAKTGQVLWLGTPREADNTALVKAGQLLFLLNDDAELIVARANRKAFDPIARYVVADSATWAQPAISGDRIFIKDVDSLRCGRFAEAGPKGPAYGRAEDLHHIHVRCAARRNDARQRGHDGQGEHHQQHDPGVRRRDSIELRRNQPAERQCADDANHAPPSARPSPSRRTSATIPRGALPTRKPDADLARALCDQIREHTVQADRRQEHGHRGKQRCQLHRAGPREQCQLRALRHRPDVEERKLAIDLRERRSDLADESGRDRRPYG